MRYFNWFLMHLCGLVLNFAIAMPFSVAGWVFFHGQIEMFLCAIVGLALGAVAYCAVSAEADRQLQRG